MNKKTYILYLPAGCSKEEMQSIEHTGEVESLDILRNICGKDITINILYFGPSHKFIAAFDDAGLLCDNPIGTVEINRTIIHGPVFILKCIKKDPEGIYPISEDEINFLKEKLNLLHGKGVTVIPNPSLIAFSSIDEMLEHMGQIQKFKKKENKDNWGK